jgi:predicted nucleotidyltransferase
MAGENNVDLKIIKNMAEFIRKNFNPQKIILFGSYAYGKPDRKSDVDLFIIMDTDISLRKQASLIRSELTSSIPIDIIVRTPQQVEERLKLGDFFIKKIVKDGLEL